jgi:Holliday junction resolvase RusA-like endonuclease
MRYLKQKWCVITVMLSEQRRGVMENLFQMKPLSANRMFVRKGRTTYKTADYKRFQEEMAMILMGETWAFKDSPVHFIVYAGLSNKASDLDNIIKPLLDTYQNIFEEFNDKTVQGIILQRDRVKRGREYLWVRVTKAEELEVGLEAFKDSDKKES